MSTTVWYNGVELRECETKVFSEEVAYDESGTDRMYYKFRIGVSSTMVSGPGYGFPDGKGFVNGPRTREYGDALASKMRAIHRSLSAPRADFYYIFETMQRPTGHPMHPCIVWATGNPIGQMDDLPPSVVARIPGHVGFQMWRERFLDCDSGPKPTNVEITEIMGGNAVRVTFEIEISLVERFGSQDNAEQQYPADLPIDLLEETPFKDLPADGDPTTFAGVRLRAVLSNRWSMSEVRNEDWAIERTITGTLRIKHQRYLAHSMRYLCFPGLQKGFQRKSISFMDDPTGLNLRYTIIDKQREAAPPPPAINWSGSHSMTGTPTGMTIHHIALRMVGPVGGSKEALIEACGRVIRQRIPGIQRFADENNPHGDPYPIVTILRDVAVVNVLSEPVVEFRVTCESTIDTPKKMAIAAQVLAQRMLPMDAEITEGEGTAAVTRTVRVYDPEEWPRPKPIGTETIIGIFSCYLQNPLTPWHAIPKVQTPASTIGTDTEVPNPRAEKEDGPGVDTEYTEWTSGSLMDEDLKDDRDERVDEQLEGTPVSFVFIKNTYRRTTGFVSLPKARIPPPLPDPPPDPLPEPEDTCSIARIHAGQCFRDFYMEITRAGGPPQLVEPTEILKDPNGITETLISCHQELASPKMTRDGATHEYSAICQYTYALSRVPSFKDKLRIATSPIDTITPEEVLLDQEAAYDRTAFIEWREPPPPTPPPP